MKVTRKEIEAASKAIKVVTSVPLNSKLSYRLSKILSRLIVETDKIAEHANSLVRKYGTLRNDGLGYNFPSDTEEQRQRHETFLKEIESYLEEKSFIEIEPIPSGLFDEAVEIMDKSGVKMSTDDMVVLGKFIAEPEVDKKS